MVSQCECTAQWQRINESATTRRRRHDDEATTTRQRHSKTTRTQVQPQTPTINGNPSLRIREKTLKTHVTCRAKRAKVSSSANAGDTHLKTRRTQRQNHPQLHSHPTMVLFEGRENSPQLNLFREKLLTSKRAWTKIIRPRYLAERKCKWSCKIIWQRHPANMDRETNAKAASKVQLEHHLAHWPRLG